jgi:membrane protease YdiL (CAAX protease family)
VITKIFCIIATLVAMRICGMKISDVGLKYKKTFKYIGCGLALGIFTFAVSYGLEMILLAVQGKAPRLSAYITNFGLSGATSEVSLSFVALVICIAVNVINVLAEEGMFRGFILKAVSDRWGFKTGNFVQALLFGIWHIVMCVLGVYDGQMGIAQAVVFAIGYVVLAGILAIEWGTCVNMTGVLWVGLSEHFFNNFIGNFLHVVSTTGTDEFQIIRIVLSNFLSLGIVLLINRINHKKESVNSVSSVKEA